MRLLREVIVDNFRSIRHLTMGDLDEYAPIIGLNGTGKSNILRALNLFFNGHLDETMTPLDLDRDYPDTLKKAKRRKRVAVAVTFDLAASGYEPRGSESFLKKYGLDSTLCVERAWTLVHETGDLQDTFRFGASSEDLRDVGEDERLTLRSFIRAVQFRYVPNHIRPADFIRQEIQPLRQSLLARLQRTAEFRTGGVEKTMLALSRVAENMLSQTSSRVAIGTGGRGVAADVPANFVDLAFQLALQTVTTSGLQATELQGSGTQSFMLLHVLDLLDQESRSRDFGWKKAYVWAIEEPESFLHAALRSRFAKDLLGYADHERRQIFTTTHQDEFVRVGDHAWLAELDSEETKIRRLPSREALTSTTRMRITTFHHPLMEAPDQALVIVEGKLDVVHLRAALAAASIRPRWRLACLDDIDPEMKTGGDGLLGYLRNNRQVLRSRPANAPVIVLRDWEDSGKLGPWTKALKDHEYSVALACPEVLLNPDLDQTFRGIERYLSLDLVRAHSKQGQLSRPAEAETPVGVRWRGQYDLMKAAFASAAAAGEDQGKYMRELARWLDQAVEGALGEIPVQLFL